MFIVVWPPGFAVNRLYTVKMPPSSLPWPLNQLKDTAAKNLARNEAASQQRSSAGREPERDRAGSTETSPTSGILAGETAESSQKPKPRIETYR